MNPEVAHVRSELEEALQFECLLVELSSQLIILPADQFDKAINDNLKKVSNELGLDGIAIWESEDALWESVLLKHLYRAVDGPELPLRISAAEQFPWSLEEAKSGRITIISSLEADIPAHAKNELIAYEHYGVKSDVGIPLVSDRDEPIGVISFFTMRSERRWTETAIRHLRLLAQILGHALIRQRTHLALQRSEERVALATEAANVGLWTLDAGSARVWTGTKMLPLLGLAPADGVDIDQFFGIVHPDDRLLVQRAIEQAQQSGEMASVEYRIVRPDGEVRWLASRGRRSKEVKGAPLRIAGVSIDITDSKLVALQLQKEKALIEAVFDTVPGLIYIWSPDGKLVRWNRQHEDITGYTAEELRGLEVERYFRGDDLARMRREWDRIFAEGRGGGEFDCTMKDGSTVPFLLTGVRLEIDGKPHLVGMGLDISERRSAETRFNDMTRQLERITRTAVLGELSGAIAHELKQPLAGILSTAQAGELMLKKDSCNQAEMLELLGEIVADTKRADAVIRGLQSLYREQESSFETLRIGTILQAALSAAEKDQLLEDITVHTDFGSLGSACIRGSRVQLLQVISNLLQNAVQATAHMTGRERQVAIAAETNAETVRIRVSDNGPGIDPSKIDSIFQPLVTWRSGGMGLGLAISRKIVEAHGGMTWAENMPCGGACVGFSLPLQLIAEGRERA